MRKSRFTDEQIVAIPREADRDQIATVAKRQGVSEQTIYTWRKRFGTFQADDVRRLKQLEAENARLKKLVVERDLEIEVMKEVASKNW
jgi:putative transposase